MGGGLTKKEIYKKRKKKVRIEKIFFFFYLGRVAVPPLRIYCLVCIAFFLSKAR